MSQGKKGKRIPFSNRAMFNATLMTDTEVCRELISLAVGFEVELETVEDFDAEVTVEPGIKAKCARLDVVARGEREVFDVEMQVQNETGLPKRTKYYHSALVVDATNKGVPYKKVPDTWVIFICVGDPLKSGCAFESFQMRSGEGRGLGDGTHTVFLSAKHWRQLEDEAPRLSQVLHYIATGKLPSDPCDLVQRIDELVDELKDDERVVRMMTYEKQIELSKAEAKAEGKAEGIAEGEDKLAKLIKALRSAGRSDLVDAALDDVPRRSELMREYGIV